jgi:hypothetical protein
VFYFRLELLFTKRGRTYSGAGNKVGSHAGAASELAVASVDSSINNIDCCTATSGGVVDIGGSARVAVGDTAKAVRCACLGSKSAGVDLCILLDVGNFWSFGNLVDHSESGGYLVAPEVTDFVGWANTSQVRGALGDHGRDGLQVRGDGAGIHIGVVDDDVGVRNNIRGHRVTDLKVVSCCCWGAKDWTNDCCQSSELGKVGSHCERSED